MASKKVKRITTKDPQYIERTYFEVNRFNRSVPLNYDETFYAGHHIGVNGSWRPYGKGEFQLDERPILKGTFNKKGLAQGYGEHVFYRNAVPWKTYKGEFVDGNMSGPGILVDDQGVEEEVIGRNNEILCHKNELQIGQQIELHDYSLHIHAETQRCIIQFHIKDWKYRVRFHEDVRPRDRDIDFAKVKYFTVLKHLPKICHLAQLSMSMGVESSYDYWYDTFGVNDGRPRMGFAGGRKTPEMKTRDLPPLRLNERLRSDRSESFFEAGIVNVGSAVLDQVARLKKQARKEQWEAMIAKRRAEQEQDRAVLIEKERKKDFEEAMQKMRESKRQMELSFVPSEEAGGPAPAFGTNVVDGTS